MLLGHALRNGIRLGLHADIVSAAEESATHQMAKSGFCRMARGKRTCNIV